MIENQKEVFSGPSQKAPDSPLPTGTKKQDVCAAAGKSKWLGLRGLGGDMVQDETER